MIFQPEPELYYCVHCLADERHFADLVAVLSHLARAHGLRPEEGRDWISGERALELLAERGHSREARVDWFALYLAGCYGVDDLLAAPRRRPAG